MNIIIDKSPKKALKEIALEEGKSVDGLIKDLIDEYIRDRKGTIDDLSRIL